MFHKGIGESPETHLPNARFPEAIIPIDAGPTEYTNGENNYSPHV